MTINQNQVNQLIELLQNNKLADDVVSQLLDLALPKYDQDALAALELTASLLKKYSEGLADSNGLPLSANLYTECKTNVKILTVEAGSTPFIAVNLSPNSFTYEISPGLLYPVTWVVLDKLSDVKTNAIDLMMDMLTALLVKKPEHSDEFDTILQFVANNELDFEEDMYKALYRTYRAKVFNSFSNGRLREVEEPNYDSPNMFHDGDADKKKTDAEDTSVTTVAPVDQESDGSEQSTGESDVVQPSTVTDSPVSKEDHVSDNLFVFYPIVKQRIEKSSVFELVKPFSDALASGNEYDPSSEVYDPNTKDFVSYITKILVDKYEAARTSESIEYFVDNKLPAILYSIASAGFDKGILDGDLTALQDISEGWTERLGLYDIFDKIYQSYDDGYAVSILPPDLYYNLQTDKDKAATLMNNFFTHSHGERGIFRVRTPEGGLHLMSDGNRETGDGFLVATIINLTGVLLCTARFKVDLLTSQVTVTGASSLEYQSKPQWLEAVRVVNNAIRGGLNKEPKNVV